MEYKKSILIIIGGLIGFWAIYGMWLGFMGSVPSDSTLVFFILLAGLQCSIVASRMFYDMIKKEDRIQLLMTPASAAQKFIPRLIAVVPSMLILSVLAYFVYGYLDLLVFGLRTDVWLPLYNPFGGWDRSTAILFWGIFAYFLLNESFFIFGAVAWPKRSFMKSVLFIALITIAFSLIVYGLSKLFLNTDVYVRVTDEYLFGWWMIGWTMAVAVAITFCAYLKFKRSTIA